MSDLNPSPFIASPLAPINLAEEYGPESELTEARAFQALHLLEAFPKPTITPGTPPPPNPLRDYLRRYAADRESRGLKFFPKENAKANQKRIQYSRDLYLKSPEDLLTGDQLKAYEADLTEMPDPDSYRARQTNRAYFNLIAPTPIAPDRYDLVRDEYARAVLKLDDTSDKAVFSAIQAQFQEEASAFDSLKPLAKEAFDKGLTGQPLSAADRWRATAALPAKHKRNAREVLAAQHQEAQAMRRRLMPTVKFIATSMLARRGLDIPRELASPEASATLREWLRALAELNPPDRAAALFILSQEMEKIDTADDSAGTFKRSATNASKTALQLLESAFTLIDSETTEGFLDEEDQWTIDADERARLTAALQGIESIPENFRPDDSALQKAFIAGSGQAAIFGSLFTGAAGLTFLGTSMAGQSYAGQRLESPEADRAIQFGAATLSGTAQAATEIYLTKLGLKMIGGRLPGLATLFTKARITAPAARSLAAFPLAAAGASAVEFTEEIVQDATDNLLSDIANELSGIDPATDWGEFLTRWTTANRTTEEVFYAIVPFALIGSGAVASFRHFKHGQYLQQATPIMRQMGFRSDKIQEIREASPEAAAEIVRQEIKHVEQKAEERAQAAAADQPASAIAEEGNKRVAVLEGFREAAELSRKAGFPILETELNEFTEQEQYVLRLPEQEAQYFDEEEQAIEAWQDFLTQQQNEVSDEVIRAANTDLISFLTEEIQLAAGTKVMERDVEMDASRAVKEGLATMEQIRARAQIFALQEGSTTAPDFTIMARRWSEMTARGIYRGTVEYYRGADPLNILEDLAETNIDKGLALGMLDGAELVSELRALEEATGNPYLADDYTYDEKNKMPLLEAMSKAGVEYFMGNIQNESLPATIRRWFQQILAVAGAMFRHARTLARSEPLMKAIKEGRVNQKFVDLIADSVGLNEANTEARYRAAEQQAQEQALNSDLEEISDVLRGRLPHPDSMKGDPMASELRMIHDGMVTVGKRRNKKGQRLLNTRKADNFFLPRGEVVSIDGIREELNERGFDFDTEADMLAALDDSLYRNLKTYAVGTMEQETTYSISQFSTGMRPPKGVTSRKTEALPVWNIEKQKDSLPKVIANKTQREAFFKRLDDALNWLREDPSKLGTAGGWVKFLRKAGVYGEVPMPPTGITELFENPAGYAEKVRGAYHGDLAISGTNASAKAGLDGTKEMRELIGEGKAPAPWTVALHHLWGILSRMLPPIDQEGMWLRLIAHRPVLEAIQSSIDGNFDLSLKQWQGLVQDAKAESADAAGTIGNAATANANSFYLMLKRLSGKWQDVANVYAAKNSREMGRRFWSLDAGALGIKNKVQRFIGLTFGIPGVIMDRWKFVELWLPTAVKGTASDSSRNFFKYSTTTPESPLPIYGIYGNLDANNVVASTALYEGLEVAMQEAINRSPELQDLLGDHQNPGGLHWYGWNAIKNEAVGHSSLDLTKDLIKNYGLDFGIEAVVKQVRAGEYFTEGTIGSSENAKVFLRKGKIEVSRTRIPSGLQSGRAPRVLGRGTGEGTGESGQGVSFSIANTEVTPTAQTRTFPTANGGLIGPATFSIRAYHGTPHKVDRFSTDKIGTGEGAQAFGYGLYMAGDQAVAEEYRKRLAFAPESDQELLTLANGEQLLMPVDEADLTRVSSFEQAKALYVHNSEYYAPEEMFEIGGIPQRYEKEIKDWLATAGDITVVSREAVEVNTEGNLYTVTLNVEEDQLLDWDKPITSQPLAVQLAAKNHFKKNGFNLAPAMEMTGAEFYRYLQSYYQQGEDVGNSAENASLHLSLAGIPGIRYLDGNSRTDGEGSYNYVIFDDSDITILEENGQPVSLSQPDTTFSLSPRGVERLERAIIDKLAKGPEERADYAARLIDRLDGLRRKIAEKGQLSEADRIAENIREASAIFTALPIEARTRASFPIKAIIDAQTERGRLTVLENMIDSADKALESYLKKQYLDQFEKLFDLAKPDLLPSKSLRTRLVPEQQRLASQAFEASILEPAEVMKGIVASDAIIAKANATLNDLYANDGAAEDIAREEKAIRDAELAQEMLEVYGALAKQSAAEIAQAYKHLKDIYAKGRQAREFLDAGRREELAAMRADILQSLGGPTDAFEWAKNTASEGFKQRLDAFRFSSLSFHQIMEELFPNSPTARQFQDRIRAAERQTAQARIETRERFEAHVTKRWGPGKLKHNKILAELSQRREWTRKTTKGDRPLEIRETTKTKREKLLPDQARAILAGTIKTGWENDPIAIQSLRDALADYDLKRLRDKSRAEFVYFDRTIARSPRKKVFMSDLEAVYLLQLAAQAQYLPALDRYGYTEQILDQIRETLSDPARDIRDFLTTEYAGEYARLNEVYRSLYFMDMPQIRNYAPGKFEHSMFTTEPTPDGTEGPQVNAMSAGFTKTREHHTARPQQVNALDVFWNHTEATNYFIGWAEVIRDMNAVFKTPEVRRTLEARFGKEIAADFFKWIDQLTTDGRSNASESSAMRRILNNAQASLSAIGLSFNVGSLLKQISAGTGAFMEMPTKAAVKGLYLAIQNPSSFKHLWNNERIQQRIKMGMSPEDRALLDASNAKPSQIMAILEAGRAPLGWTDALFTTLSSMVAYNYHLDQALKSGLSETAAEEHAITVMDRVIIRTAQPATTQDKSLIENTTQGLGKFLLIFRSDPRQKIGLALEALRQYRTNKITKQELARRFFWGWVMYGLLAQLATDVWHTMSREDDDDDDWSLDNYLFAAAAGPLSGLPLFGAIIETGIRGLMNAAGADLQIFANSTNPLDKAADGILRNRFIRSLNDDQDDTATELMNAALRDSRDWAQIIGTFNKAAAIVPVTLRVVKDVTGIIDNVLPDSRTEKDLEIIAELSKTAKEARDTRTERIDALVSEIRDLDPEEQQARLEDLDTTLARSVRRQLSNAEMTRVEKALRRLPTEQRATAIETMMKERSPEQRSTFRRRLEDLGILTPTVDALLN